MKCKTLFPLVALCLIVLSGNAQYAVSQFSVSDVTWNDMTATAGSGFYNKVTPTIINGISYSYVQGISGRHDGPGWSTQIAIPYANADGERMYFRKANGITNWGDWNEIWHSGTSRMLLNKPVDNGTDQLQVNGSAIVDRYRLGNIATPSYGAGTFAPAGSTFAIYTANAERLRVDPSGNVGIGTTSPQAKLAVNGTILAKKVKVTLNTNDWPDYVFHRDYVLPPLLEVASYIREHQHLPGIPSAEKISEEGLDVGEFNKQLLKKVEELTLYVIELKKEISEMKEAKK
ncbi:pyocin knob domain-containing protein [Chitinophaga niabensis]|uniref:Chaperone of endosialidase n=1 Tax=Chitinophaga niabensis TaxID=536979 RepID=A0A1N6GQ68_9BACT|nr:pyocin knob domain-containing protein [Chitinophaga niabensis]SIO09706.1 hypothetical protein SAMN04488055_2907 [Chitinophaga niabensis]